WGMGNREGQRGSILRWTGEDVTEEIRGSRQRDYIPHGTSANGEVLAGFYDISRLREVGQTASPFDGPRKMELRICRALVETGSILGRWGFPVTGVGL